MASEIGWIRALVLSIGSSTYAYTIVLGVYIAGLGIGSALASRYLGARAFGPLQLASRSPAPHRSTSWATARILRPRLP